MKSTFEIDAYPGRPKILFIGFAQGSHTQSWIDLIQDADFNIRLFGLRVSGGLPPDDWPVKTYVTAYHPHELNAANRRSLLASKMRVRFYRLLGKILRILGLQTLLVSAFAKQRWPFRQAENCAPTVWLSLSDEDPESFWLAQIIRKWKPDIIHTMGLDPAGFVYQRARKWFYLEGIGKWVLQLRGGSDLTLNRHDPEMLPKLADALQECDQLLSDNAVNFQYAAEMGMPQERISELGTVPGTGGVDVAGLSQSWRGSPGQRRLILWPKAYDSPWSKPLPIFEALRLAWDRIQPCEVHILAMNQETQNWFQTLPDEIRNACRTSWRIPRNKVMDLMLQARVMLAPSLIDGTPNVMFEAMAAGAFPILSPLDTITGLVEQGRNVLFARNLYPEEIAEALIRAMSDDELVDRAAELNLELVGRLANRKEIRPRVVHFYESMAGSR